MLAERYGGGKAWIEGDCFFQLQEPKAEHMCPTDPAIQISKTTAPLGWSSPPVKSGTTSGEWWSGGDFPVSVGVPSLDPANVLEVSSGTCVSYFDNAALENPCFWWGNRENKKQISHFRFFSAHFRFWVFSFRFAFLARPFLYLRVSERIFPGEVCVNGCAPDKQAGNGWGFLLALQRFVGHSSPERKQRF